MHALVLQCGGPTAVVNTSLAAVVRRWRASMPGGVLSGGHHGLRALFTADWRTLTDAGDGWLAALDETPGMALGGGRDRLSKPDVEQAVGLLAARGVEMLFLIGGNGTMAAGRGLAACAARARVPLRIIGVPKTIDNDVPHTDVCPGFPSAARFLRACAAGQYVRTCSSAAPVPMCLSSIGSLLQWPEEPPFPPRCQVKTETPS